jgi:nitroreductase
MRHSVSVLHHAADEGVIERRYADALHEGKQAVADLVNASENVAIALENLIASGRVDSGYSTYLKDLRSAIGSVRGAA